MMKMIKPIVNISKVIDPFDAVITGFDGVLYDGRAFRQEAVDALINMKRRGKKVVLLSNTPLRVEALARLMRAAQVPLAVFDAVITAGEILHYKLKAGVGEFSGIGRAYYKIGDDSAAGIFSGLDFEPADDLGRADFLYMGGTAGVGELIDSYLPVLEHAASLSMPFVCAGNDTSGYRNGELCVAAGALAEQYAVLGGRIITVGKPDARIFEYALDSLENIEKDKVLVIGDNIATDIKGADLAGLSSALISKAVHVNFLGEGYIPDVAKTRELATNFDASPDFIISNLRW